MKNNPIIALIDMDCFYVQVELRDHPEIRGKPSAVVQYNNWKGGGIIAVSYEARAAGVTRNMRGDEAQSKCPDIHLFRVPELRGKADLTKYREAGAEVVQCLGGHAKLVERASVDEAFIDLTDEVDCLLLAGGPEQWLDNVADWVTGCGLHVVGQMDMLAWLERVRALRDGASGTEWQSLDEVRLARGFQLVSMMRAAVSATLGFSCSAGLAHSKTLAKLAAGLHKPSGQTAVPETGIALLLRDTGIGKIRNLGGKTGNLVQQTLDITTMGELADVSYERLTTLFGDRTGPWLWGLARGHDDEGVLSRPLAQSVGCSKRFPGPASGAGGGRGLGTVAAVRHWLLEMATEVCARLRTDEARYARRATHLRVTCRQVGRRQLISRVVPLVSGPSWPAWEHESGLVAAALTVLGSLNLAGQAGLAPGAFHPGLVELGLSAGRFRPQVKKNDISRFLVDMPSSTWTSAETAAPTEHTGSNGSETPNTGPQENQKGFFARFMEQKMLRDFERSRGEDEGLELPPGMSHVVQKDGSVCVVRGPMENSSESLLDDDWPILEEGDASLIENDYSLMEQMGEEKYMNQQSSGTYTHQQILAVTQQPMAAVTQQPIAAVTQQPIATEDQMLCEECGLLISVWEFPEHDDWHVARRLQAQLRAEVASETVPVSKEILPVARKRIKPPNATTATDSKRQMSLKDFFK